MTRLFVFVTLCLLSLCSVTKGDVSVIVLPLEGLADQGAAVDVAISEQLAAEKKLVIVDRSLLDAVLAEKTQADGFKKKLAGGGWILSGKVLREKNQPPVLFLDLVSARTGDALSRQIVSLSTGDQNKKTVELVKKSVSRAVAEARAVTQRNEPLLEVMGTLAQPGGRLAWMVGGLAESLGGVAERKGLARAFKARLPLATKEERLLRVLGLTQPAADGDGKVRSSVLPDAQIRFVLTDSMKTGVTFEQTPIALELTFQNKQNQTTQTKFTGTVGEWEKLGSDAQQWLGKQLVSMTDSPMDPILAERNARQRSKEILRVLQPAVGLADRLRRGLGQGDELRQHIVSHALRAAHLDPTNEQAAFLIAKHIGWQYRYKYDSSKARAQALRGLGETSRFFQRFPHASISHQYQLLPGGAGWLYHQAYGNDTQTHRQMRYSIVSPIARQAMKVYIAMLHGAKPKSYGSGPIGGLFLETSITHVSDERLDQEYAYWKDYYAKHVTPAMKKIRRQNPNYQVPPWEYADALFAVRRKDIPGVKAALSKMAKEYPFAHDIWGDVRRDPSRATIFRLLTQAGASDARSWKPTFPQGESIRIPFRGVDPFIASIQGGRSLNPWNLESVKPVVCQRILLPSEVMGKPGQRMWRHSTDTYLFPVSDNEVVVVLNRQDGRRAYESAGPDMRVIALKLRNNGSTVALEKATELPVPSLTFWPALMRTSRHVHWTQHDGRPSIYLATESGGLIRYDRKSDGEWTMRHYTSKDGLPVGKLVGVSSIRDGDQRAVLIAGTNPMGKYSTVGHLVKLEPKTHQFSMLTKPWKHGRNFPQARTRDGRMIATRLLGRNGYDAELSQIDEYILRYHPANVVVADPKGLRFFRSSSSGYGSFEGPTLQEFDANTLKTLKTAPGAGGGKMNLYTFGTKYATRAMGAIVTPASGTMPLLGSWPTIRIHEQTTSQRTLFMTFSSVASHPSAKYIIGYTPAPAGDVNWAERDQWMGPFESPDNRIITQITGWGEDQLLIATRGGMFVARKSKMMQQADSSKAICTTQQWRDRYPAMLEKTNWRMAVISHLGNREYKKAAAVLAKVTDSKDQLHWMLWASYALARQGEWIQAAESYQKAIKKAAAEKNHPAEAYAQTLRVACLYRGERPKLARAALDIAVKRFPQLDPTKHDMLFKLMNAKNSKVKR